MTNEDAPRVQKSACPALARKNNGPEMTEESANFKFVIKCVKRKKRDYLLVNWKITAEDFLTLLLDQVHHDKEH